MKLFFVLILFMFTRLGIAQIEEFDPEADKNKFLIVRPFDTTILSKNLVRQINKVLLQNSASQERYQVILSNLDHDEKIKPSVNEIFLEVRKDKKTGLYEIDLKLMNLSKNKLMRRIKKDGLDVSNILFNVESAIKLMFNYKKRRVNKAKDRKKELPLPNDEIDFKKRIMALKKDVQNEIKIEKQERERAKLQQKDANENQKEEVVTNFTQTYEAGLGYSQNVNRSVDNVALRLSLNYLYAHFRMERDYLNLFFFDFIARVGKLLNTVEFSAPSYSSIAINSFYRVFKKRMIVGLGVERESTIFRNLPVIGDNLKLASNSIMWVVPSLKLMHQFNKFNLVFFASYGKLMTYSSDYKTIEENGNYSGNKISFGIGMEKILKLLNMKFFISNADFSSSGGNNVSSEDSSTNFVVDYIF